MRPAVLIVVFLLAACESEDPRPLPVVRGAAVEGVVVVDGDTIRVAGERVRLIGIDAPERGACFFGEAAAALEGLIGGRPVRLESDRDDRDRYGRLLRYVYRDDGLFLNLELVKAGYAIPLTVEPNDRHATAIAAASDEARASARGLWKACPTG